MKVIRLNRNKIKEQVPLIAGEIIGKHGFVSPVDIFIAFGKLQKDDYEKWRFNKIPYLEKAIQGSLNNLLSIRFIEWELNRSRSAFGILFSFTSFSNKNLDNLTLFKKNLLSLYKRP